MLHLPSITRHAADKMKKRHLHCPRRSWSGDFRTVPTIEGRHGRRCTNVNRSPCPQVRRRPAMEIRLRLLQWGTPVAMKRHHRRTGLGQPNIEWPNEMRLHGAHVQRIRHAASVSRPRGLNVSNAPVRLGLTELHTSRWTERIVRGLARNCLRRE